MHQYHCNWNAYLNIFHLNQSFGNLNHISGQLTPKHWETHGCVVSTVATDALVLKHQAISIHNAD